MLDFSIIELLLDLLNFISWEFPIICLAFLSYSIEFYTHYKTHWRLYVVSILMAMIYPVMNSYYPYLDTTSLLSLKIVSSFVLLFSMALSAYASLRLLSFQKISLGKTKQTVILLLTVSVIFPLLLSGLMEKSMPEALFLIFYNLSITCLVFIFLTVGKLTQKYIPRYHLLAYTCTRVGSVVILFNPVIVNFVYLNLSQFVNPHYLVLAAGMTQLLSIIFLLIPVIMVMMEAEIRGEHLKPIDEQSTEEPMKYKLKTGYSYLIREESLEKSSLIFQEYVTHNYHGLLLSRTKPSRIRDSYNLITTPILWMTNAKTDEKSVKPKELERMALIIKDFILYEKNSVILIQRLDYLITENDFKQVLRFIHNLNDIIMNGTCILLISINPGTLTRENLALLRQELEDLTDIDKIALGEPLHSTLSFIFNENKKGKTPSFKAITKQFMITKTTARKRIYELESRGLIKIVSQGRYKFLEATEKGKNIVGGPASMIGDEQ